jgi:hypothetical protein
VILRFRERKSLPLVNQAAEILSACFQDRTAARTAERELSQLAAATLATGALFMKLRGILSGEGLRIGTIRAPVPFLKHALAA